MTRAHTGWWKLQENKTKVLLEHTTTRLYVEHCRLTSEQGEEETVCIDKDITLVGGDSKRVRLSYKYVN